MNQPTPKTVLLILQIALLSTLFTSCGETSKDDLSIEKWHTLTLQFEGPETAEDATENPFLNYRLTVDFQHQNGNKTVRGFYAADGNAAETSATNGNIWQVRFTPDEVGEWTYTARMEKGEKIALSDDAEAGETIKLMNDSGTFQVTASTKTGTDFRANGRLSVSDGYFKFEDSDNYFLKVGANSPENFLAFADFDGTYRTKAGGRDGEARTTEALHKYEPHISDWDANDPTWQGEKGKGIIGAANYMARKGMNSIYFLTFNVEGDGKDVWMYTQPDDFMRFDVSKLAQWEILFQHMQSKGIVLHFVLQETENEELMDGGDTGEMRQLYYNELIARFGHHLALIWNVGEENGPNNWSEGGQNDQQRRDMIAHLKQHDPYQNTVVIHTLPSDPGRGNILKELIGFQDLDGISLQESQRERVAEAVQEWTEKSTATGQKWLVMMDEIGEWHTGALTDTADVDHTSLTHHVLWGSLLSGAGGVEWYFGGRHVHNDLTSEDWRQRDRLWTITNHAKTFFEDNLPYWEMTPQHDLVSADSSFCLQQSGMTYALYIPDFQSSTLDLSEVDGSFSVSWFDPYDGGDLQIGSVETIEGGGVRDLGQPQSEEVQDWVVLVRKEE
ncbi:MAG: DUF5060 domain-containing protein [Bacteroidota bacterium]